MTTGVGRASNAMIGRRDLAQVLRGFLMGGADIIPGVSGGTVALILGIYERLVTAISRFDLELLSLLRQRRLRDAAAHVDLRFLLALVFGIGCGVVGLASLMHHLLEHRLEQTFAAFFGMIVASSLIVARMVDGWHALPLALVVASAAFAYWLVGLPFLENPPETVLYLFPCGMVAICAMILPGISGAFILLILGEYYEVTGVLKGFAQGEFPARSLLVVAVFGAGAVFGILGFSKILRRMLDRFHAPTMAVLAGFMLGSLRKIWPFKNDTTPEVLEFKLKQFENVLPDLSTGGAWLTIMIAVVGFGFVLALSTMRPRA